MLPKRTGPLAASPSSLSLVFSCTVAPRPSSGSGGAEAFLLLGVPHAGAGSWTAGDRAGFAASGAETGPSATGAGTGFATTVAGTGFTAPRGVGPETGLTAD